jgi:uncharacterized membrane protein YvbJ
MPTCPHCGATVPEGAVYCGNCGATLNASTVSTSSTTQTTQSNWPTTSSGEMQTRFERALRRAELLGYVAAGLGVAILVVIIVLYLL